LNLKETQAFKKNRQKEKPRLPAPVYGHFSVKKTHLLRLSVQAEFFSGKPNSACLS